MKKSERKKILLEIYHRLFAVYGKLACCLDHATPFQLLAATILSAQCTDKKVNSITPALFEKYPTPEAMAKAVPAELETMIHPCGFYHAKAKNLIGMAQEIVARFAGEVPADMEKLVTLPGVGRKTANVVLGDAFEVPGLPVDTHVIRLTNLIGLVKTEDAVEIETILCDALPPEYWSQFSHQLIIHGRTRCPARRPDCEHCEIRDLCRNHNRKKSK